jgi:hypothetical protein
MTFDPSAAAIKRRRSLTEALLSRLLEQAHTGVPVDLIKSVIFDYSHKRFNLYVRQLFAMFDSSPHPIGEDILLPVIADAWNYFPHKSLNGRSPAEVMAEQMRPPGT